MAGPIESSRRRARVAVALGIAGVLTMPAAVVLAQRSQRVSIFEAAYAAPLALLLGVLATGMARRAKRNLQWLRLDDRGTGVASVALTLGILAVSLGLVAALSIGFYEAVRVYQHHRH